MFKNDIMKIILISNVDLPKAGLIWCSPASLC